MKYSSFINADGQVTLPQEVRVSLGLQPGDLVEFVTEGEQTLIRRTPPTENPFAQYAGALGTFPGGVPEINAWLRDLRDGEE